MGHRRFILAIVLTTTLIGCEAQLSQPRGQPASSTTIPPRTLAAMQPLLSKTLTPQVAEQLFGKPDEITGSGLIIYVYHLPNGQKLWLGFPGYRPIFYAKVQNNDGSTIDLPLQ